MPAKSKTSGKIGFSIFVLLIISSILVIGIILLQSRRMNESASKFQLEQSIQKVNSEFNAFILPLNNTLQLLFEWGKSGLYENRQLDNFVAKLQPLSDNFKIIEYISIASEDGYFLALTENENLITTKHTNFLRDSTWSITQWTDNLVPHHTYLQNLMPATKISLNKLFSEDFPEDSIINSPVRYLFETGNIGINYGKYFTSKDSGKRYRISVGLNLNDIARWIDSQRIGKEGRVLLFDYKGRVFRPLKVDTDRDDIQDSLFLTEPDSTLHTMEYVAVSHWKTRTQNYNEYFRFKFDKEYWWAGMLPVNPTRNPYGLWLGVIVPERDLVEYMHGTRGFVIIGFLLIMIASIISISVILARSGKWNASSSALTDDLADIDSLLKLIERGESEYLEFKSTVRQNLHTGKPGKEIEIAWLKGVAAFLNSEGGILLIGVNDSGEIVGLDDDNFANDDKCLLHIQNLIKQHIGLEFLPYLDIKIRESDRGKIVSVACRPSKIPVFLKNNDKEQFFVRSGPSSVAMPVSKALKYIEDRKKKM
jgi:hypothetical protein